MTRRVLPKVLSLAMLLAGAVPLALIPDSARADVLCDRASCLDARDVNGVRLDMTVAQVAALFPKGLEPLGRGQFQAVGPNRTYDFGFSALGHLYRIDSSLDLGYFIPDRSFELDLKQKLVAKYGTLEVGDLPSGVLYWDFAERYQAKDGMILTRATESLSAMLTGGFGMPMKLDLKLMDFRILRRDLEFAN